MTYSHNEATLEVYTPLPEILSELARRREDATLREKVDAFFPEMPHFLGHRERQYAFFSRPFVTPNFEFRYFLDIIPLFGLSPLIVEYPSKMVYKNKEKRGLGELCLVDEQGGNECERIIDFANWDGKDLNDVRTLWNEPLRGFHRALFDEEFPELDESITDFSEWFDEAKQEPGYYYLRFLSLFILNGVLFDNYLNDDEETPFFEQKVLPSFRRAAEIFGVKPLIFPLLPIRDEKSTLWLSYPSSLKCKIEEKERQLKAGAVVAI